MKSLTFMKQKIMTLSFLSTLRTSMLIGAIFAANLVEAKAVWEIKKNNDTVYIGGTVHVLPVSEFPLPKQFTDTYKKTDVIVLETKVPEPSDGEAQMKMMQALSYKDGDTLKNNVSTDTYQKLGEYFAGLGVNIEELNRFKPGFVATMMVAMEAQRVQLAGDGVDAYFGQLATKDNKKQAYLETLDFQLDMLANQGVGEEDLMLVSSIDKMPELKQTIESLISAWREGDIDAVDKIMLQEMKESSPQSYKAMMTDRNHDWIPKIEAMFNNDEKEFVLVGIGHLAGEENVLELLLERGYEVTQL